MDGQVMIQDKSDIWQGGKSEKLNFEVHLGEGNHVLEVFGAEKCCDGTTGWKFKVVCEGEWMDFSCRHLNKF